MKFLLCMWGGVGDRRGFKGGKGGGKQPLLQK